jgi:hypothetical protein
VLAPTQEHQGQGEEQGKGKGGQRISWRRRRKSTAQVGEEGQEIKWRSKPRIPTKQQQDGEDEAQRGAEAHQRVSPTTGADATISSQGAGEAAAPEAAAAQGSGHGVGARSEKLLMGELIKEMDKRLGMKGVW